ncbi:hypothetical protein LCM4573_18020 [Rhizobium sp. LCM 4573]|nr:hypothetical protein LCM4573_18020 [Rhizobium sp. LCM 4573]
MRTRTRNHLHESNESFLPIVALLILFICGGLALVMYQADNPQTASVYVEQSGSPAPLSRAAP